MFSINFSLSSRHIYLHNSDAKAYYFRNTKMSQFFKSFGLWPRERVFFSKKNIYGSQNSATNYISWLDNVPEKYIWIKRIINFKYSQQSIPKILTKFDLSTRNPWFIQHSFQIISNSMQGVYCSYSILLFWSNCNTLTSSLFIVHPPV